jgi:hypothetical protein
MFSFRMTILWIRASSNNPELKQLPMSSSRTYRSPWVKMARCRKFSRNPVLSKKEIIIFIYHIITRKQIGTGFVNPYVRQLVKMSTRRRFKSLKLRVSVTTRVAALHSRTRTVPVIITAVARFLASRVTV